MKILISSRCFYPVLGGAEVNAELFAREFVHCGHEVKVITQTPGNQLDISGLPFPFEVIRSSSLLKLWRLLQWCDVYFQQGIGLKNALPLLLARRPWIVRHLGWIRCLNGDLLGIGGSDQCWNARLKHFMTQFCVSVSVSQAIADHLHHPSIVIPNPYRDDLFRVLPEVPRTKELVFLGRLVSEKGLDLLIRALTNLKQDDLTPHLTVVGAGPEEVKLYQLVGDLDLSAQVTFAGAKSGEELVQILNQHQIMVIPSLYDEPFGIVALEGIACGCVVVGSTGGGLKDAIGPCGPTFPNGNVDALTQVLQGLLTHPDKLNAYREMAESHLSRHQKTTVAKAYLQVFEGALA